MGRALVCRGIVWMMLLATSFLLSATVSAWEKVPEGKWISDSDVPSDAQAADNDARLERAIASKLGEIETLKNEVEQLREQLASGQRLEIELKVYEVNLSKMRRLGVDISMFENGKSVTKPVVKLSDLGKNAGSFLEALAKNNVAKLAHRHEARVNSGDRCSIKGKKLQLPKPPKSPELEVYDVSTDLVAKLLDNGRCRVEMRVSLTSLEIKNEGQKVPGFRESMMDLGFECNDNQDFVVQCVPEFRTSVKRTESGLQAQKEEFQRVVVVRVKKFEKLEPQNEVQPASAVQPL